jgi:hypothetical protein
MQHDISWLLRTFLQCVVGCQGSDTLGDGRANAHTSCFIPVNILNDVRDDDRVVCLNLPVVCVYNKLRRTFSLVKQRLACAFCMLELFLPVIIMGRAS